MWERCACILTQEATFSEKRYGWFKHEGEGGTERGDGGMGCGREGRGLSSCFSKEELMLFYFKSKVTHYLF